MMCFPPFFSFQFLSLPDSDPFWISVQRFCCQTSCLTLLDCGFSSRGEIAAVRDLESGTCCCCCDDHGQRRRGSLFRGQRRNQAVQDLRRLRSARRSRVQGLPALHPQEIFNPRRDPSDHPVRPPEGRPVLSNRGNLTSAECNTAKQNKKSEKAKAQCRPNGNRQIGGSDSRFSSGLKLTNKLGYGK
ncbi:unnamed protein product [Linum tenue]|uniref:Uncharacterized protein n=1 Tax=Linum tenue TaxID=586396 RepID=A0AAV0LRL7_9ROSI|nr:unnamed protein product [Linum tenue]